MKKIMSVMLITTALLSACNSGKTDTAVATKDSVVTDVSPAADTAASATAVSNNNDADFAMAAADGGMAEVMLSQLAQKKATAASVKELSNMMVKDHSAANDELKAWAQKNNVTLPAAVSAQNQKKYDDLAAKKGVDFDKAYTDIMISDHQETIAKFQTEANNGTNADLKAWASGKLPTLNHHLEMSNTTKSGLK